MRPEHREGRRSRHRRVHGPAPRAQHLEADLGRQWMARYDDAGIPPDVRAERMGKLRHVGTSSAGRRAGGLVAVLTPCQATFDLVESAPLSSRGPAAGKERSLLSQIVLPVGVAYLTAVAVAVLVEVARPRPLRAVLADAPRILRYATMTVGVLIVALWFYAYLGLVPSKPF